MNSRVIMLALLTISIGSVLGISVMQHYYPASGKSRGDAPLFAPSDGRRDEE